MSIKKIYLNELRDKIELSLSKAITHKENYYYESVNRLRADIVIDELERNRELVKLVFENPKRSKSE